ADSHILRLGFHSSTPGTHIGCGRVTVSEGLDVERGYRGRVHQKHEFHAGNANFYHRKPVAGLKENLFAANWGIGCQQDQEKQGSDHGPSYSTCSIAQKRTFVLLYFLR